MRFLIAGQPKTGNVWLRTILVAVYDLIDLNVRIERVPRNAAEFGEFVAAGSFIDQSVLHQHLNPKPEVLAGCATLDCHILSMVRNPYDAFVSFFFYINRSKERFQGTTSGVLIDKPMDHPDVLEFIATTYTHHLAMARRWMVNDKAIVLRYEDLHANPLETVRAVTDRIAPVPDARIDQALSACSAEALRKRGGWLQNHIRVATTGDWRAHLLPVHLEHFRRHHADVIEALGYRVE